MVILTTDYLQVVAEGFQNALKAGLLAAIAFPVILVLGIFLLRKPNK